MIGMRSVVVHDYGDAVLLIWRTVREDPPGPIERLNDSRSGQPS